MRIKLYSRYSRIGRNCLNGKENEEGGRKNGKKEEKRMKGKNGNKLHK